MKKGMKESFAVQPSNWATDQSSPAAIRR